MAVAVDAALERTHTDDDDDDVARVREKERVRKGGEPFNLPTTPVFSLPPLSFDPFRSSARSVIIHSWPPRSEGAPSLDPHTALPPSPGAPLRGWGEGEGGGSYGGIFFLSPDVSSSLPGQLERSKGKGKEEVSGQVAKSVWENGRTERRGKKSSKAGRGREEEGGADRRAHPLDGGNRETRV